MTSDVNPAFDPKAFLATLVRQPGVYRMLDAEGKVIYVGKARNLKARVSSYFSGQPQTAKTMAMVAQIAGVEVTTTSSEIEALLLECNLIKQHRPRYNVMLRDDKSFPYIHLSTHEFPRLGFYRGSRKVQGRLFGPYPNAGAVREALLEVQKLFGLRPCNDLFFANRSRPCLQFQIKRCSAPCVREISSEQYAEDVKQAVLVLNGNGQELIDELVQRMEQAATQLEFERAARLRDRIQAVKSIQAVQSMNSRGRDDADIVACVSDGAQYCVAMVFVRGGRNLGSMSFFPKPGIAESDEVLSSFIMQYYLSHDAPDEILVDKELLDSDLIASTLSQQTGRAIQIRHAVRGERARWVEMAQNNATLSLRMRQSSNATIAAQLQALAQVLNLPQPPSRMECFDISHTMGEATVASCVVFNGEGPLKSDYRRFNIEGLTPGDDYGALRQAIQRRYARVKKNEVPMPDVLFIDGGENQCAVAIEVLNELEIHGVKVVSVAKGADRKAGQERLFIVDQVDDHRTRPGSAVILPPDSGALHLIQRIRDEAHRFAITGHRQRRGKARQQSVLETIVGLGPRRRRQLLQHFGGMQGLKRASSEDIQQVKGFSSALADTVYSVLHPE